MEKQTIIPGPIMQVPQSRLRRRLCLALAWICLSFLALVLLGSIVGEEPTPGGIWVLDALVFAIAILMFRAALISKTIQLPGPVATTPAPAMPEGFPELPPIRVSEIQAAPPPANTASIQPTHTTAVPAEVQGLKIEAILLYRRRGQPPERRPVTIRRVEIGRNDDGKPVASRIVGYCHLRKGPRTFIVASILEMADGTTGELLPHPSEWLLAQALGH